MTGLELTLETAGWHVQRRGAQWFICDSQPCLHSTFCRHIDAIPRTYRIESSSRCWRPVAECGTQLKRLAEMRLSRRLGVFRSRALLAANWVRCTPGSFTRSPYPTPRHLLPQAMTHIPAPSFGVVHPPSIVSERVDCRTLARAHAFPRRFNIFCELATLFRSSGDRSFHPMLPADDVCSLN